MTPRDAIKTITDFERFLRARGFSRKEAKTIAGYGWKVFEGGIARDTSDTPAYESR